MKDIIEKSKQVAIDMGQTLIDIAKLPKNMIEIHSKHNEIQKTIDQVNAEIEPYRIKIDRYLEELGKEKLEIIATTIEEFTFIMSQIQHFPFKKSETINTNINAFEFSSIKLKELNLTAQAAKKILLDGAVGLAGGAATASAACGTIALLGTASTGASITALHGVALTNATLAWLGGGAIAAGGGGIALGTIVLGGIVVIPAIAFMAWKGNFSLSKKAEEIEKAYLEALEYKKSIEKTLSKLKVLESLILNIKSVITQLNTVCIQLNKQSNNILNHAGKNYSKYSNEQKLLIEKHADSAKVLLTLLDTPIINADGDLNNEIIEVIQSSNDFLVQIGKIHFKDFKKNWFRRIFGI